MDNFRDALQEVSTDMVRAASLAGELLKESPRKQVADLERSNRDVTTIGFPQVQLGESLVRNSDGNVTSVTRPDGQTIDMKYVGKELKAVELPEGQWTKNAEGQGWTFTDRNGKQATVVRDIEVKSDGTLVLTGTEGSVRFRHPDGSSELFRADNALVARNADGNVTRVIRPDATTIEMAYTGKQLTSIRDESGEWTKDKDGKGWTFKGKDGQESADEIQVKANGDIVIKQGTILKTVSPNDSTKIEQLHTVKPGESPWSIAEEELRKIKPPGEKISPPEILAKAKEIAKANNMDLNSTIHPGDTLKLPRTTKELEQAQAKEGADLTFSDLKKGLATGNLSLVIDHLRNAEVDMTAKQYQAYLTRLNELVQKELPGTRIVGAQERGGSPELIVCQPDGSKIPVRPDQAHLLVRRA